MNENIGPKNFNDYDQRNDYANGEELMVAITLAEYRNLVSHYATAEEAQRKQRMEACEKDKQIKDLKEQIVALKATLTVSIKRED